MSKEAEKFITDLKSETNSLMTLNAGAPVVGSGLSSGSLLLNEALSGNPSIGYVKGRVVEIYGPEQSGKTTAALSTIVEAQKLGWPAIYIDVEHALDPKYMEAIGINHSALGVIQPSSAEEALDYAIDFIKKGCPLIIIDSIAALTPQAEVDAEIGKSHMGLTARLMGQFLRKAAPLLSKSGAILVCINQIRHKIGVMFGNPETTPGGKALAFYASYRLEVRSPRGGAIKEKDMIEGVQEKGIVSKIKVVKNKLHAPCKTAEIPIIYGLGYDKNTEIVDYLNKKDLFVLPPDTKLKTKKVQVKKDWYSKKELLTKLSEDNKFYQEVLKICL